jgi:hypothetical protein
MDKLLEILRETETILGLLALIFGGGGIFSGFLLRIKKENSQLTKMVDKSVIRNEEFHKLAEKESLFLAARAIKKKLLGK